MPVHPLPLPPPPPAARDTCSGLAASGAGVPRTTKTVLDAHPVYLTPASYAFAIWAIVYVAVAMFAVVQALPSTLESPLFRALRPLATLAFVANGAWVLVFPFQLFWAAVVAAAVNLYALYRGYEHVMQFNMMLALARLGTDGDKWKDLLAHFAFSANLAWLTVAILFQLDVALLEEGWAPSADFAMGQLVLIASAACWAAFTYADLVWALVAIWALLGVGANQLDKSVWGCLSQICTACAATDDQRICTKPSPLGWKQSCANYAYSDSKVCVLEKSGAIRWLSLATSVAILCFLVLGVVRGGWLLSEGEEPLQLTAAANGGSSSMARPRSQASASFGAARDALYTELEEIEVAPAATSD